MKSTSHIVFSAARISRLSALVTCLLAVPGARAANDYWAGVPGTSVDTNWTTAANWTSAVQTYYNQVEFLGVGANPNNVYSVNNVLNATTGVSQEPIYELDYTPTNGNYTTLINPGITMNLAAGRGYLTAGADVLHTTAPAPANAVETITIQGPGAGLSMIGNLTVAQGSLASNDTHNVTLDLSGLDNFVDNGTANYIYVAANGAPRANGTLYLAKTNNITLGNGIQICSQSTYSNSLPVAVYLGINNTINLGSSGNLTVGGTGTTAAGAFLKFNPAFLGGATPPTAFLDSIATGGRINNFYVCNESGTFATPASALCDFSGGSVYVLISTLQLGLSGSGPWSANGVLTFDNGIIDTTSAYIGRQQNSAGGMAVGTVNINNNSTYGTSALLRVDGTLSLAAVTGTLTAGTAGTVNINGGELAAGTITAGAGISAINSTAGTIALSGDAGTLAAPIGTLALTNSTLSLAVLPAPTNVVVGTLITSGANVITISSVPPEAGYPLQIPLVKYLTSLGGAGYNFSLSALPTLCTGYLSNNTANASIDLVLNTGPLLDIWNGAISGNWDFTTANWTAAGAVDYADGNFVLFPDGATTGTVDLTTTVMPGGITVTNNSLPYTFNGGGAIAGATGLIKAGSGTLVIDNSGGNTFTGNVTVSAGTLQVGNSDTSGNLPNYVAVANAGTLVFDRQDDITVGNTISGAGLVAEAGGGQLELTGANTFTGPLLATNNSTVQLGSGSAAGAGTNGLIIANGSTLDINGYATYKPIIVSGTGVNGNGAIINSGGPIYDSSYGIATNVMLTGDTTFNMNTRWDLGAPNAGVILSTGGHPYNLTLNASGYFEWKNVTVDTNLGNIYLMSGTWGLVGTTSFGNPNSNVVISSTATVDFYGSAVALNKQVDFQDGYINNDSGANIIKGAVTLEPGYCNFNIGSGTSLTFSNSLIGSGIFYQTTGSGTTILDGNSPNFTGGVSLYTGQLTLNGVIGGGITTETGTTLAGSGVASNLVSVAGAFLPGGASTVGTFTAAGGLTLAGSAAVTMDLGKTVTPGGTNSDLVAVVGDLTVNGNNININPISGTLASGAYILFTYTGSLNGSFGTASTVSSSRFSFTIDTSVPNEVRVIVSGVPNLLVWNNGSDNGQWDVQSSLNWSNLTSHVEDQFYTSDTVTFDDSIKTAVYPTTNIVIPSGQLVVPNLLTNNSTVNYTISGAGKISGGAQIIKLGSSTLTISNADNYTGGTTIMGGMVVARGTSALGTGGAITVTNGATVDIGYGLGSQPVFVSGAGVGGNGALVNNSGSAIYDSSAGLTTSVTLTGNTTFGGTTRWDLGDRGTPGTVLSTGGNPFNLTITGSAGLYFEWDNLALDTNLANITIEPNITLGVIGASTFGNPANTLTISSNSSLEFYNDGSASPLLNKQVLILNGGTLENGGGTTIDLGPVVLGVNAGDVCGFNIGGTSLSVSNVISGPGSLFKLSSGSPLYLGATNTYTGSTIVSNGVLALTGYGSIASSSSITVTNGGIVDASARVDQTLTLASGQTLQGSGTINGNLVVATGATISPGGLNAIGTLTVTNAVTLSGTTIMEVNETAGTHDQITAGLTGITFGGTLAITNLAGTLAAGDSFKLFSAGTYSGSFANIEPATPGSGLVWDTSSLSSGIIQVASAVSTPPTISGITVSGGNIVITGTNNTGSGGTYHVLTTTNLAQPLTSWVVLTNGSFGSSGAFSVTNAVGTNAQQFFILQEP
jgi:fibronectin-binding autotransporter adhesin